MLICTPKCVFQVVDNQQVPVVDFSGRRAGNLLTMTIIVEADEPRPDGLKLCSHGWNQSCAWMPFPLADAKPGNGPARRVGGDCRSCEIAGASHEGGKTGRDTKNAAEHRSADHWLT